ncbi:MAG: hypothetical protein K2Q32_05770, partial [Alphaproteobacteria bacterium]|nr:hypothetical protein [Alphaproteobacteria bacterium]
MLKLTAILLCLILLLHPLSGFAEEMAAPKTEEQAIQKTEVEPIKQSDNAWQTVRDFEETRYFSVAGPPMQEDAERATAET